MTFNTTTIETSSNGAWQGDNPLNYAFPLLIIQTTLVLLFTRSLAFLLKPLRQPKVVAEIIGGILLGPSALGRNKAYLHRVFPSWSTPILETVTSIGLLFFLFLVGLELDLNSIRRSGRKAFGIAVAGISLPFVSCVGVAFVLRKTVSGADQVGYAQFLVFMGVALSITAFPVLARILAELKLLTTPVGETAMAAAAFNDVAAWVLLALAVALSGGTGGAHHGPLVSLWILLSGLAFVIFMLTAVRPAMARIGRQWSSPENEAYICFTLVGVLVSGFVTDLIGIHSIFGAFVFGLTIPKEGEFAGRLIERIEDFVSGLLLPLYFASSGLKTDVSKIHGLEEWGLLGLVIVAACVGKISGTFLVAVLNKVPAREALTLGVLMNTKGLVELIVLNIGKERKVLNDETFAILVLMALFTTFITTPTVMALYKPARAAPQYRQRKLQAESQEEENKELRILACLHGPFNVPSIINLIEMIRGRTKRSPLKLYIMHLVELTERSSSIVMALRERKNGLPFRTPLKREPHDRLSIAFEAYGQLGRVRVRPMTAVSALTTMHEDVCSVAEEKRVAMVILPFHKRGMDGDVIVENVGPGWRLVNQRVLRGAPCSVGILVDRGLGGAQQIKPTDVAHRVCLIFFGGPDDREALEIAGRMGEHPGVVVTVVRFCDLPTATVDQEREKEIDESAMARFRARDGSMDYEERMVRNVEEKVLEIGRNRWYDLIVAGRSRYLSKMMEESGYRCAEHADLGPVGDILASSGHHVRASVLVVQQHGINHADKMATTTTMSTATTTATNTTI